jgi:putative NIF3 family GTP cyclohydrolase 1 type 2
LTTFEDIHRLLDAAIDAHMFRTVDDPNGIWRTGVGDVAVVGLLLEPWVGLETWVSEKGIDVLVIHRPWGLPEHVPGNPGVLAYHLAFDERMTVGFNPQLASFLDMTGLEPLGHKSGRPIGMIGNITPRSTSEFTELVAITFGVEPVATGPSASHVERVAIAGASWTKLISEAVERGADMFVTGELRTPGRSAVKETGLMVLALGHHPVEIWGLHALARILGRAFPDLTVYVFPSETNVERPVAS